MKKKITFPINERIKKDAKQNARIERKLFSDYSEEAYLAGVGLKEFARINSVPTEDILFYLNRCISGTEIKKWIAQNI